MSHVSCDDIVPLLSSTELLISSQFYEDLLFGQQTSEIASVVVWSQKTYGVFLGHQLLYLSLISH